MDMYKSDQYNEKEDYPAEKAIGQELYLELKVESPDSKLQLFPDWCKATLTDKYDSEPKHVIMENT